MMKEQYHANKEKWLEYQRKYRVNHRAEVNANQRKYRLLNQEKVREQKKRYYRDDKLKRWLNGEEHLGSYRNEEHRERHKIAAAKCRRKYATKYSAMTKAWQKANPDKCKVYLTRYRTKHPDRVRASTRKHHRRDRLVKMGLTEQQYNEILVRQSGVCAICKNPPWRHQNEPDPLLHLDHDHDTGEIRGLLCPKCNKGIGLFNDDAKLLIEAACYVTAKAKEVAA